MHNKHSFKTRKTRKTRKARKMHGGKLHEACDSYIREKLRENYDVDNDEDVEEMNHAVKHQSLSIEKFKEMLHKPNEIHIFGDRSHGDEFLVFVRMLLNSECLTEDEKTKVRESCFFSEGDYEHREMVANGIAAENLCAVDKILNIKPETMPIEKRMEGLNLLWSGYLIAKLRQKRQGQHYFISAGTAHLYPHQANGELVPSFPFVFRTHSQGHVQPYVMFVPNLNGPNRYSDLDIRIKADIMIEPQDFPYIIFD